MAAQRCTVQRLDDVDLTFNGRFHIHRELNRASRFLSRSGKPSGTQLLTACAGGATAVVFEAMDMKNSHLVALKARDAAAHSRSRQMRASPASLRLRRKQLPSSTLRVSAAVTRAGALAGLNLAARRA